MPEVMLSRTNYGFMPVTEDDQENMKSVKMGELIKVKWSKPRNYEFHKKFFALLNVGFDHWEPQQTEFKGLPVQKNFERFRKDCICAAGYYDLVQNLKGEVRAEAKSISFASMEEEEFEKLYSAVANVLLQQVLKNYTREDLDHVVMQVLGFV